MAMLLRSKTLALMLGLLAGTAFVAPAVAGDHAQRHRHHGVYRPGLHRVVVRNRVNIRQQLVIRRESHHRRHGQRDTYSGDVAIVSRPGVGTWSYGAVQGTVVGVSLSGTVKILDLTSGKTDCAMEKGVCVMRGL
jgi:hypothetical protein